jgi:hypothetical protein
MDVVQPTEVNRMNKKEMQPFEAYGKFMTVLAEPGTLLGVIDNDGQND